MKMNPLGDRILVDPDEIETAVQKGGIYIPDTAQENPQQATIIALGTGKVDDDGNKVPFGVKVGDRVLMPKFGGTEFKMDDKEYQIISEDDILGIIG
jgi:chaperonin GroES